MWILTIRSLFIISFAYRWFIFYISVNEGIPCYLISRHDGDLHEKLKRWRIESLFDEVIHLRQEEENPALLSMQTPYLLMIASVNVMKYIARWALIHLMSACWICFLRSDHEENVVFIHLESLNQAIYSHRQWFPCLNSIAPHSLRFNNFISQQHRHSWRLAIYYMAMMMCWSIMLISRLG
jgi:hypothetical protein